MGYHTIRLSPASQDTTMIITKILKFRYNQLPTGVCALGEIFQANVDELLGNIKGLKNYIDDVIVLSKDIFENNIEQLRIIFCRLCAAGSKVISPKFSFGL